MRFAILCLASILLAPNDLDAATIYIPESLVADFIQQEDTIARSYAPDVSQPAPATIIAARTAPTGKYTHVVRRGETLGQIAQRNRVSLHDLRRWNHLRGDRIHPGQRLVLHREVKAAPEEARVEETIPHQGKPY